MSANHYNSGTFTLYPCKFPPYYSKNSGVDNARLLRLDLQIFFRPQLAPHTEHSLRSSLITSVSAVTARMKHSFPISKENCINLLTYSCTWSFIFVQFRPYSADVDELQSVSDVRNLMKNFPLRVAPFSADRERDKHGETNKAAPNCFANLPKKEHLFPQQM